MRVLCGVETRNTFPRNEKLVSFLSCIFVPVLCCHYPHMQPLSQAAPSQAPAAPALSAASTAATTTTATATTAGATAAAEYPLTEQGFRQFIRNRGGKVPPADMNVSYYCYSACSVVNSKHVVQSVVYVGGFS